MVVCYRIVKDNSCLIQHALQLEGSSPAQRAAPAATSRARFPRAPLSRPSDYNSVCRHVYHGAWCTILKHGAVKPVATSEALRALSIRLQSLCIGVWPDQTSAI